MFFNTKEIVFSVDIIVITLPGISIIAQPFLLTQLSPNKHNTPTIYGEKIQSIELSNQTINFIITFSKVNL